MLSYSQNQSLRSKNMKVTNKGLFLQELSFIIKLDHCYFFVCVKQHNKKFEVKKLDCKCFSNIVAVLIL